MFEPETEDMLPRAAPMPMVPIGLGEHAPRPTVPEVSIVFGQQDMSASKTSSPPGMNLGASGKQSYASWKKQVLPKVTFPPKAADSKESSQTDSSSLPYSTLYPMRPPLPSNTYVPSYTAAPTEQPHYYMRSQESGLVQSHSHSQDLHQVGSYHNLYKQRRSLDALPHRSASLPRFMESSEVLTICAGTQTESSPTGFQENVGIAKGDFERLLSMIQDLRNDQLRLSHICESILMHQQEERRHLAIATTSNSSFREVGIQCEITTSNNEMVMSTRREVQSAEQNVKENVPSEKVDLSPKRNMYNHLRQLPQFQETPKAAPAAQSTAYQLGTPRPQRPPLAAHNQNIMNILPKPITEKSMVMNELALKYLPSNKINELLQDMHVTPPRVPAVQSATTPAAYNATEEMERGPNDLSNASYKYLKKYRLLPEESDFGNKERDFTNSPLNISSPRGGGSPYQCIVESPRMTGTPTLKDDELTFDLERIRNQPKLL